MLGLAQSPYLEDLLHQPPASTLHPLFLIWLYSCTHMHEELKSALRVSLSVFQPDSTRQYQTVPAIKAVQHHLISNGDQAVIPSKPTECDNESTRLVGSNHLSFFVLNRGRPVTSRDPPEVPGLLTKGHAGEFPYPEWKKKMALCRHISAYRRCTTVILIFALLLFYCTEMTGTRIGSTLCWLLYTYIASSFCSFW